MAQTTLPIGPIKLEVHDNSDGTWRTVGRVTVTATDSNGAAEMTIETGMDGSAQQQRIPATFQDGVLTARDGEGAAAVCYEGTFNDGVYGSGTVRTAAPDGSPSEQTWRTAPALTLPLQPVGFFIDGCFVGTIQIDASYNLIFTPPGTPGEVTPQTLCSPQGSLDLNSGGLQTAVAITPTATFNYTGIAGSFFSDATGSAIGGSGALARAGASGRPWELPLNGLLVPLPTASLPFSINGVSQGSISVDSQYNLQWTPVGATTPTNVGSLQNQFRRRSGLMQQATINMTVNGHAYTHIRGWFTNSITSNQPHGTGKIGPKSGPPGSDDVWMAGAPNEDT